LTQVVGADAQSSEKANVEVKTVCRGVAGCRRHANAGLTKVTLVRAIGVDIAGLHLNVVVAESVDADTEADGAKVETNRTVGRICTLHGTTRLAEVLYTFLALVAI
jgi:hypothetical protein